MSEIVKVLTMLALGEIAGFSLIVQFDGGVCLNHYSPRKNRSATLGIFFLGV